MNPNELLRIVDSLHREKNIDPEIVFQAIEAALVSAAKRQYGEESEIVVRIQREDGAIQAECNDQPLDPEEMIGRIGAQTAKQVIIQKIREAERDALIEEFQDQIGHLVSGIVQRNEGAAATVSLGNVEAILPRSEQIPGDAFHPNQRVRAVIFEVKPQGSRVKVVLSRTRPALVQRLFEQEIPEIADGVITVNAISREPGYRSKVAVSSSDQRVDCVGACVGMRGNRIRNIVDELASERIDIVRYDPDPEIMIPNALQPAEVEQVLLCDMIGRAIVLVREDQLPLAIGRRGQNVRLASKLCGWDIEIMTADELDQQIQRAVGGFSALDGVDDELAQRLVEQGYLSYDDLSVIEPEQLADLGGLTMEQVDHIIEQAETQAEQAEIAAAEAQRRAREEERAEAAAAAQNAQSGETTPGDEAAQDALEDTADASAEEAAAQEHGDESDSSDLDLLRQASADETEVEPSFGDSDSTDELEDSPDELEESTDELQEELSDELDSGDETDEADETMDTPTGKTPDAG